MEWETYEQETRSGYLWSPKRNANDSVPSRAVHEQRFHNDSNWPLLRQFSAWLAARQAPVTRLDAV